MVNFEIRQLHSARESLPVPSDRRCIRRAAGLTQADLAAELGVSTGSVRNWEEGTHQPNRSHVIRYALMLDELRVMTDASS